jgi:nicotinate-nucleotide adenylyltransferase
MRAKKRIALYGGTFDPVHVGHLEVARGVSELFEIDKVLFIPAQMAPHKIGRPVTPALHRHTMLALATQDDPRLVVSTFELDAPDRRYTVDTVEHFQRKLDDSTELFFIMGADSWSEITTWRDWERLLTMINHIVVTRPGYEPTTTHVGQLSERIVDLRTSTLTRSSGIFFTDVVMNDVSATKIRQLASKGCIDDLANLLPGPVLEYIKKYGIYRESNEAKFS